jgi:hypothetical protein
VQSRADGVVVVKGRDAKRCEASCMAKRRGRWCEADRIQERNERRAAPPSQRLLQEARCCWGCGGGGWVVEWEKERQRLELEKVTLLVPVVPASSTAAYTAAAPPPPRRARRHAREETTRGDGTRKRSGIAAAEVIRVPTCLSCASPSAASQSDAIASHLLPDCRVSQSMLNRKSIRPYACRHQIVSLL